MITYYYRSIRDKTYKKFNSYRRGAVGVIDMALQSDIVTMAEGLELEVMDLVDVFDLQEVPRLEIDPKYMLLFVRSPLPIENRDLLETQLYMLVYSKSKFYAVTHGSADLFLETLSKGNAATTRVTKLLVQFLLNISKKYSTYINEIARIVDEKRKLLGKIKEPDIEHLLALEGILNEYVAVLSPMQNISGVLKAKNRLYWKEDDEALLEDLMNSLNQSIDVCQVTLKKILSLRDSFQIIFTNKLNQTVQLLTSVTILLTIPTMIASIFGMNVVLPFSNHPQSFWLVLAIASALSFILAIVFKRNRWL